jgi:hypothetical protein
MSYPRIRRFVVLLLSLLMTASCVGVSADRHTASVAAVPAVTATPTPDAATRAKIAAVMAGTQPVTQTFTSPDGVWQAEIAMYGCVATGSGGEANGEYAFEALFLMRAGAEMHTQVDSQLINCGGLGAYGFQGLCWSPDSRYFYYDMARAGVPDGSGEWTAPIRQLEVHSGMIRDPTGTTTPTGNSNQESLCSSMQP